MISSHLTLEDLQAALGSDFEIRRKLGEGKMATVYQAVEKGLDRPVALKVLAPQWVSDPVARSRFQREAKAAASLVHPNIVQVFRQGMVEDTPYLAMQYVEGRTIEERLAGEGRFDVQLAREVLRGVAEALAAAHEKGVVHRDLRPPNLLWDDENERAVLSDFGIAVLVSSGGEEVERLTRTGELIGDPRYMSPERVSDEEVGPPADVYALGVLGYELLTGEGPYEASSAIRALAAHLDGTPRDLLEMRPEVDEGLAQLLRRCLNRNPKHRPRAADVARMLSAEQIEIEEEGDSTIGELVRRRLPHAWALSIPVIGFILDRAEGIADIEVGEPWPFRMGVATSIWVLMLITTFTWFHGEKGRQKAPPLEFAIVGAATVLWAVSMAAIYLGR